MSLDAIRKLRRHGQKPSGVVQILVGDKPRWLDDDETVVIVRPGDDPRLMDWRPLVGLWVAILCVVGTAPERKLAVGDALEQVGVSLFGMADEFGAYPLTLESDARHEMSLRRMWELLCR